MTTRRHIQIQIDIIYTCQKVQASSFDGHKSEFHIYIGDERGALRAFVESNRVPSMGRATGQQVIIILASVLINYSLAAR
jgi:RNA-splicing ligase RtcB